MWSVACVRVVCVTVVGMLAMAWPGGGGCLGTCSAAEAAPEKPAAPGELVSNPDFSRHKAGEVAEGWTAWTAEVEGARPLVRAVSGGVLVEAPGKPFAVGGLRQEFGGVQGGKAYAVEVACRVERIASPLRSVLVRLVWLARGKAVHPAGMYVRGPRAGGSDPSQLVFRDVLVAPSEADGARLSLEVKWPGEGRVVWQRASVRPTAPLPPRKVKIGTVYLRPSNSTPQKNLKAFCEQIDAAGRLGLDIVCLPEAITLVGTRLTGPQTAEPIPGPSTEQLGAAAKRNRLWVVAGLYEQDGPQVYNSAVLLDRQGRLAGKYRKIHLPREEWAKGITPGHEYPLFQTDFGRVAIQICYDWFFPEVDTIFALQGAEVVFAPTWGTTFADREGRVEGENVFRVRARDNGIYLVPSVYDGSSMVIDPLGRVLVSNKGQSGVFWCEVDLNQREPLWWVGYWRAIGPRDRMPGTYGPLGGDPTRPAE